MIITTEQPLRYVVDANQGQWVENLSFEGIGAVKGYRLSIPNELNPVCIDGLDIEVWRYPQGDYLADCYYSAPTAERAQSRKTLRTKDYKAACTFAEEWLSRTLDDNRVVIARYYPHLYASEGQTDLFEFI